MGRGEIRPMTNGDLSDVSMLHGRAFPGFFLSTLGPDVLREYYRAILEYPASCALVAVDCGQVCGFVAGFADPASFYRHLRSRVLLFFVPLAQTVVRKPSTAVPIARRLKSLLSRRPGPGASTAEEPGVPACGTWELASLAVDPHAQGKGYGGRLVASFIQHTMLHSATRIVLRTDALENDHVNLFYERLGFEKLSRDRTVGSRLMNTYEYRARKVA
jgi:ribosomal protein S18 acetylase RimI-like enzyme